MAGRGVVAERPVIGTTKGQATRKRTSRLGFFLPPLLFFVFTVGAWQLVTSAGMVSKFILPAPFDIVLALIDLSSKGFFWDAARITSLETIVGFLAGISGGFIVGALSATFPLFRRTVYPYVIGFQSMPRVALAPVFLAWFGFGFTSKAVLAATIAFFPLVINTIVGLDSVDRDARLLLRSFGASRWQMFRRLTLPSAAPIIFGGIKTAISLALIGAIVAEFVGASEGLGVLLHQFSFSLDIDYAFAILITVAVLGLVLFAIVSLLDRKLIFWRDEERAS